MSASMLSPEYLTTVAISTDVITELGLGIEASISANGDIALPASHRSYLYSVHLPASDDKGRLNVGARDRTRREESISTVIRGVDVARDHGAQRGIIHSMGLARVDGTEQGDWDHTVSSLQQIADHAQSKGLELVLENVLAYWDHVPVHVAAEAADRSKSLYQFGYSPQEWWDLWQAIDRTNVGLCLDTSHATSYGMLSSNPAEQVARVNAFLDLGGDLITHVHWSDNYLGGHRGRNDGHLHVGQG